MLSAKPTALASASSGVTAVSDQDAHIWYTLSRAAADATKQNTASKPPAASGWIATRVKAGIVSSGYARQTGRSLPRTSWHAGEDDARDGEHAVQQPRLLCGLNRHAGLGAQRLQVATHALSR